MGEQHTREEIAGYRIIRKLSAGGMGEVYLVQHPRLPRRDALKLLDHNVSRNPEFRTRFQRESEVLATLSHPNIVTLHDRGEHDGRLWLTMEFVDGPDAAQVLRDHGPMPIDLAVDILTGTAAALDAAWRDHRITHRDVKPGNILISFDGSTPRAVKLADFGIAKAAGEAISLTSTGITVGTMACIAPEALDGQTIDNRADIYSLACTAYQFLTGTTPFTASTTAALITAHLHHPVPPITDRNPQLPATLNPVFDRALAKHPGDRHPTCNAFIDDLRTAAATPAPAAEDTPTPMRRPDLEKRAAGPNASPPAQGSPVVAPAAPTWTSAPTAHTAAPMPVPPPSTGRPNRRKLIAAGAVIAIALAGGIGIVAAITGGDDTPPKTNAMPSSASAPDAVTTPNTVIATIPAKAPGGLAVTPDGAAIYITNSDDDTVSVLSTSTNTVTGTIPVGEGPTDVAIAPNGTVAYVTNFGDNTMSVIDTAANRVTSTAMVGDRPLDVAITPSGNAAMVAHDDAVSVFDTKTRKVTAIPLAPSPNRLTVAPDGRTAYITSAFGATASVIDIRTNAITATIGVGRFPRGVAVTPDGMRAYITNSISDSVSVIDTTVNVVIDTVRVGKGPQGVAISPDGATAVVANFRNATVSVLDIATNEVTTTIPVGRGPQEIAITPDGTKAYTTNDGENTVSVIALA